MIRKWFWSALLALMLAAALQGQSRESVLKVLAQTANWSPADKPIQFDEKNVEDLVGRHAPAIGRYGFNGATRETWNGPAGTVRITLYEMVDASAAYGWFTLSATSARLDSIPFHSARKAFVLATAPGSGNQSTS